MGLQAWNGRYLLLFRAVVREFSLMANHRHLEHSILVRKGDLLKLILNDCGFDSVGKKNLVLLLETLSSLLFMEFAEPLEAMKSEYYFFDPDSNYLPLISKQPASGLSVPESVPSLDTLEAGFIKLLEHANFKRVTWENVHKWEQESSKFWGLHVEIRQEEFDRLLMYYRGETFLLRRSAKWWAPWKQEKVPTPGYSRFAVFVKMKKKHPEKSSTVADHVFLKLFKDLPKNEIPMVFPGAKARLNRLDQSMIGYPLVTGFGLVLYNIIIGFLKVGIVALVGITIWPLALAFGGYGYRSYYNYVTKRQNYELKVTKNLYFQLLDSNAGVISRLMDEAEEQQSREVMLGYYCLLKYAPEKGWTSQQLDDFIELFFTQHFVKKIDYDVVDGIKKLKSLGLVEESETMLKAIPIENALQKLQTKWAIQLSEQQVFSKYSK